MTVTYCKYCPTEPSAYYCTSCNIGFCLNCVPEDKRSIAPRCTLCRKDLQSVNSGQVIPPFWTQWLYFLRLPFSPGVFITLLIFASIALLLPTEGIRSLVIGGIYWGLLLMMLFELTNLLAEGRVDTPTLQEIWKKGEPYLLIRLLVQVIFITLLIYSIGGAFGSWATVGLLVIYGLGFPASVLILSVEKKFFSAVNPIRIIGIIASIGLPYLLLYGTWLAVVALSIKMYYFQLDSHFIYTIAALQVSFYFWTVWFAMLGYAIYQYHQRLGIAVATRHKHHRHQQMKKPSEKVKSAAVKEAEILVSEERFSDALSLLHSAMSEPMAEMDVHRFYLKLLVETNDTKRLGYVSKRLVRQFVHQENHTEATHVAVIVSELLTDWSPELSTDAFIVAKGLITMGRRELALNLLKELMITTDQPELLVNASFEAAKLMAECFNQDQQAVEILQGVIDNYPDLPIVYDVKEYLKILKSSLGDD